MLQFYVFDSLGSAYFMFVTNETGNLFFTASWNVVICIIVESPDISCRLYY